MVDDEVGKGEHRREAVVLSVYKAARSQGSGQWQSVLSCLRCPTFCHWLIVLRVLPDSRHQLQ